MSEKTLDSTASTEAEIKEPRIFLVNRDETKEKVKELKKESELADKKSSRLSKISAVGIFLSMAGFFGAFQMPTDAMVDVGLAGAGACFISTIAAGIAEHIVAKRRDKIEAKIAKIQKVVDLREEAKTNPNIIVKERTEEETRLLRQLEKNTPKSLEDKGGLIAMSLGILAGGCGFAFGGEGVGVLFGGVTALASYAPFGIAAKIAERRERKLKEQLTECSKKAHPKICEQDLVAEMNRQLEEASRKIPSREELETEAERAKMEETVKKVAATVKHKVKKTQDKLEEKVNQKSAERSQRKAEQRRLKNSKPGRVNEQIDR